jgi:TrmH family RNA methyltransferase
LITSPDNPKLKQVRKLQTKRERARTGLFVAEGEDLVAAAAEAGAEPEWLLAAEAADADARAFGRDAHSRAFTVDPKLLADASALGSGTRILGVYRQRWSEPRGQVSVYLHRVGDPGNVGTIIRSAHAFADGPVILGPGCADPYSPKAVRASMGSIFARPPARSRFEDLGGTRIAFVAGAEPAYAAGRPVVLCFGSERGDVPQGADVVAGIPMRGGVDSLNVAMAATVALYEQFRMARHG